ncbi:MAG: PEP-CTERM sorting domain-containing protein [Candidatus Thiodiazotropha sp. (ex Notomyrtea botanica)]|nr:PEP-CTERM sorting domain-containing protein [Candidatus Thiodiazotropha sp. (ex Notomyrtea botanica)]
MKKVYFFWALGALLISSHASAVLINQTHGTDTVVYDTENKLYWYPYINEFINKNREDQLTAIDNLDYAGSSDWFMASGMQTYILKHSLADMATVPKFQTEWNDFGNPSANPTDNSPWLAHDVFSTDFFTPTTYIEGGAFWSGGTPAVVFNGRTDGYGYTNVGTMGSGGFGGDIVFSKDIPADDHWVAHDLMNPDNPYNYATMLFNLDQHYLPPNATYRSGFPGPAIGAWVATRSVPEPSTLLLMTTGLAGLGFASRKKKQA